ncbi:type II toxin-antitoxin system PemK/MazF family toxin [Enterococcus sp. N249-2]
MKNKNWRNYSDEEMLEMLKKEIVRLDMAETPSRTRYQEMFDRDQAPSPTVVMHRLNLSWREIMEKIDLTYNKETIEQNKQRAAKRNGKWKTMSDEDIKQIVIKEFDLIGDNSITSFDKHKSSDAPSSVVLTTRFGSWKVVKDWWNEGLRYKKGDIVIVDFGEGIGDEKQGLRPAVVISNNVMNRTSDNVLVAPLTNIENKVDENHKVKLLPWQSYLSNKHYKGLKKSSVVQLEDIRSISKKRIEDRVVETLSKSSLLDIERKLAQLFYYNLNKKG